MNGSEIKENDFDEIELQLNYQDKRYALKLLLSEGGIVWDSTLNKYVAYLTQEQTYALKSNVEYQLRVLKGDTVSSSVIGKFDLGETLSKKVL